MIHTGVYGTPSPLHALRNVSFIKPPQINVASITLPLRETLVLRYQLPTTCYLLLTTYYLFIHLYRHITAEGLFSEVIPSHGIRPRPAPAADIDVLAGAASAAVFFEISEFLEQLRVLPDI